MTDRQAADEPTVVRIKMLQSVPGAPDGVNVRTYHEGQEYDTGTSDLTEDLAESFLVEGLAELVEEGPASEMRRGPNVPRLRYIGAGQQHEQLPARDLHAHELHALSADEAQAALDSGLYTTAPPPDPGNPAPPILVVDGTAPPPGPEPERPSLRERVERKQAARQRLMETADQRSTLDRAARGTVLGEPRTREGLTVDEANARTGSTPDKEVPYPGQDAGALSRTLQRRAEAPPTEPEKPPLRPPGAVSQPSRPTPSETGTPDRAAQAERDKAAQAERERTERPAPNPTPTRPPSKPAP